MTTQSALPPPHRLSSQPNPGRSSSACLSQNSSPAASELLVYPLSKLRPSRPNSGKPTLTRGNVLAPAQAPAQPSDPKPGAEAITFMQRIRPGMVVQHKPQKYFMGYNGRGKNHGVIRRPRMKMGVIGVGNILQQFSHRQFSMGRM